MSRNIETSLAEEFAAASIMPLVLVMLTFRTGVQWVWSGVGPLEWNGHTFTGVGSLGEISDVNEGSEIHADGITVALSGIDTEILAECLDDIQPGAPAKVWVGCLRDGEVVGAYVLFAGTMDKAPISITPPDKDGKSTATITLSLENKMIDHARASQRRYTTADQHANGHPTDIAFNSVEALNDQSLIEGR
jgi:hypothetical protein